MCIQICAHETKLAITQLTTAENQSCPQARHTADRTAENQAQNLFAAQSARRRVFCKQVPATQKLDLSRPIPHIAWPGRRQTRNQAWISVAPASTRCPFAVPRAIRPNETRYPARRQSRRTSDRHLTCRRL